MRTFGTIIFGLLFILCFQGYFLAQSITGYPLSTSAVVETAQTSDLYGAFVGAVDLAMVEVVKESDHKALTTEVANGIGDTLKDAIPESWFYETFETAYGSFVAYVEEGKDNTEIDLTEQKEKLRSYFDKLVAKYGMGQTDARIQKDMNEALAIVPDKITIGALFAKMGNDAPTEARMEELRSKIKEGQTATMIGLGVLLVLFILICLLAMKSPKRFLISVGVILTMSGGLYLIITNVGTDLLMDEVKSEIAQEKSASSAAEKYSQEKALEVAEVVVHHAIKRANTLVMVLTLLGLLMFVGGFFVKGAAREDEGPSGRELYGS
ncbi:MAG: hypothetical protein ACI9WU_000500 [Myxococcota bacterium]|jgi:hypothetical protein